MEQKKKRVSFWNRLRGQTVSTVCFLLLAGIFLYACVLLVGQIFRRELMDMPDSAGASASPEENALRANSPAPAATEPLQDVSAIFVPDGMEEPPDPTEEPDMDALAATPSPTPPPATPAPTLLPVQSAPPFSAQQASFVLLGFDEKEYVDWVAIVRVQGQQCTVLSVPRNTLSASKTPLMQANTINYAMRMLRTIWPVDYPYYVDLKLSGLPLCVDQFGGITLDGKLLNGDAVQSYLKRSESDELLRIPRQQAVIRSYLSTLQQTNWLKLLASKFTMQPYLDSNLSTAQLLELYTHFRGFDINSIHFLTLPVDSVNIDGTRYYEVDAALVNRMLEE